MKKTCLLLLTVLLLNFGATAQPTYNYTGGVQTWVVPAGVHLVSFDAYGAAGGMVGPSSTTVFGTFPLPAPTAPGKGGRIQGFLAVTPGSVLSIYVGGAGKTGTAAGCAGGYNGGGNVATRPAPANVVSGGGGGGATDIRAGGAALANRVVVAAGGGGAAYNSACTPPDQIGGNGGGLTGDGAFTCTAILVAPPYSYTLATTPTGGTQTAGGIGAAFSNGVGSYFGNPGALGFGGDTGPTVPDPGISGGGGGGYYGGGAGGFTGGAGGSSYGDALLTSSVTTTPGVGSGDGTVTICILSPGLIKGAARLCTAQTLALTDSVGGGTWSSSNPAIATVGSTGIVTGISAGNVYITYTVISCTVMYAVVSINVTQSPKPVNGSDPLCMGSTVTFSDSTTGGYWTSSNVAAATIGSTTGLIKSIYPGTSMITYNDPSGGCYSTYLLHVDGIAGPTRVCKGLSIPLVSSTGGGVWTSSDTTVAKASGSGTTGTVTGVGVGIVTIAYSSTVCPSTYVVTVNPVAPNSGADSLCQGGTGYVTNVVGGGTWTSNNPPVAKVVSGTGLVSGISGGTAIMSYLLPTGCLSTSTVTIIPPAPPITGFFQACPGNSSVLSDALTGGIWSSLNTSVATISSTGTVTAITPDTVSILYTIRPGCATYTTFLVNPVPFPITGIDSICPGVTDTLHNASIGGFWSTSTPVQDTVVDSNGIFTSRLPGTAVVRYTLPTGCFITKNIYIFPVPVPVVSYDPYSGALHLDKVYPKNYRYQWYDSITGLIPHATSPTLAGTYSQWYFVEITDSLGCKGRSGIYHFDSHQVGVGNVGEQVSVHMYPNPVSGTLFIESSVKVRAVLSTMDGKIAIQQADAKQLDLSGLASAVYFISLYDESGQLITVQKLVKE